jgi:nicotinamide mononucleotide transporter
MGSLTATLAAQFENLPAAEVVAVATAIAYLVLVIRQSIWCWPSACISTAIYVVLCIDRRLYMESVLYVFYVAMAVYGWAVWLRGERAGGALPVTRWRWRTHAAAIAGIAVLAAVNGWLLAGYTDAALPYVDSLTTWGAIWTTFLVARKVFENWWYWLVIDSVSVLIYWERGLELTALLFVIYLLLIPFGVASWRRSMTDGAPA